jgi:hypothetical protein
VRIDDPDLLHLLFTLPYARGPCKYAPTQRRESN